jgi:hypothetical protein
MGLKLNGTHQLLVFGDVNIFGDKHRYQNLETLKQARKVVYKCRENYVYVAVSSTECRTKS